MTAVDRILGEADKWTPPLGQVLFAIKSLYFDIANDELRSKWEEWSLTVDRDLDMLYGVVTDKNRDVAEAIHAVSRALNHVHSWMNSRRTCPDSYVQAMLKKVLAVMRLVDANEFTTFCLEQGIEVDWL